MYMSVVKMQLHMKLNARLMVIDIYEAEAPIETELATFFYAMYAAVQYFLKTPVKTSFPCISPTRSLTLQNAITQHNSHELPCRVFEKDGFVYKLYDTKTESPNFELAQLKQS